MKRALVSWIIVALACNVMAAKTWYVDDDWYEKGGDGSEARPFGTIQDAVTAASKNDVIKVLPGTYNQGSVTCDVNGNAHNNRVVIDKVLTIESTEGAAVTHIVGQPDPETGKNGVNAIRCFIATNNVSGAVIRGFTLRDSYGGESNKGIKRGGAFVHSSAAKYPCFESCVVSNCAAHTYGVTYGGTWVRCLFTGNRVTGGRSFENSSVAGSANLAHCVIVSNGDGLNDSAVCGCNVVNCTIVGNSGYGIGGYAASKIRNCIIAQHSNKEFYVGEKGATDILNCAVGGFPVASPLHGDYRVVAGSDAELGGDIAYLNDDIFKLPSGVVFNKDFTGATITDTDGKIHVGAVQDSVKVNSGALVFVGPGAFNGVRMFGKYACTYAQATEETDGQWQITPDKTMVSEGGVMTYLNRIDRASGSVLCAFPDQNDVFTLTPPMLGVVSTNTIVYSKGLWVNSESGNDTTNKGSQDAPYATIQKAVNEGGRESVIFVAPGRYNEGVTGEAGSGSPTYGRNRLYVTASGIRIRSTGSAANTFLEGESDSESEDGLGPNAIRCFRAMNSSVCLQGFTLTKGYAENDVNTITTNLCYGTAALGTDGRPALVDCVIDGCYSSQDILRNVNLYRCEVKNCVSYNNSIHSNGGLEWGCWLHDNTSKTGDYYGYIGSSVSAYHCTLVTTTQNGLFSRSASVYNSVAIGGERCSIYMKQGGNVLWNFKNSLSQDLVCTVADPLLCPSEPYVVSAASPIFGAGVNPMTFWEQGAADFDGRKISWSNEVITSGATSQISPRPWVLVRNTNDALSPSGYVLVKDSLTLQANADSKRPCIGYVANGVTNLFENTPAPILEASAKTTGYVIEPICTSEWFVDVNGGDDEATGFSRYAAKKSLANILSNVNLVAGDTVWASPGVYDDKQQYHNDKVLVASRAVVPAGVTLASTDGAAVTEIVGAADTLTPDECPYTTKTTDPRGCGPKAVRCVTLMKDAKLVGFTLRDGRTRILNAHFDDDCSAAGVLGASGNRAQATVERCVIKQNISFRGGAARYCTLINCELDNNKTFYGGAVGQSCDFYGCYMHDNEDIGFSGREVLGVNIFENCTVNEDVSSLGDAKVGHAYNTLFLGNVVSTNDYYRNCAFVETSGIAAGFLDSASIVASAEELQIEDGRPVVGANVAIGKADTTLDTIQVGAADLTGFQRVMNGQRDIGALEADWRSAYAKILGRTSYLSVVSAGSRVEATKSNDAVSIMDGTMEMILSGVSQYSVGAKVTGSGTLTILLNGEVFSTLTAASGSKSLAIENGLAENSLSFEYIPGVNDTGAALLTGVRRSGGFYLIVK